MFRLPLECLLIILEKLEIKDLLNCRLVSKAFRYATSKCRINELICIDDSKKFRRSIIVSDLKWYSTNQQQSLNNLINLNINKKCSNHKNCKLLSCYFDFLSNLFNLKFIKRLKIDHLIIDNRFETEYLAKFQLLEHLEINQLLENYEYKRIIKLNKLKVLCINKDSNSDYITTTNFKDYKCIYDAPNLNVLHHQNDNFYLINLLKPETIKQLYYPSFLDALFKFNNLEHLVVNRFSDKLDNESINDSIIHRLPNLKILDVFFTKPSEMNSSESHQSLCNLIDQRNKLKSDLKINVNGLSMLNIDQFHELIDKYLDELVYDFIIDDYDYDSY